MTTEIGRVKCWISTERLRQKEVLGRETGMVYNVKTTTTTTQKTFHDMYDTAGETAEKARKTMSEETRRTL